ncbi:hypothetical protein [Flavobacterium sp. '19STA2R22 D10 B1']|uniref:hypothetical protein n=1 Tax=Flavobacterium aerium TaxID=3037261 RepID=UPI00278BD067|nr:hypothetical protein [Flavobacterium sp. '19STA2R22 D10 B1']
MNACGGDWDEDYYYYNLYDQLLIKDKSITPFLLTYNNGFYSTGTENDTPDENIQAWKKFASDDPVIANLSEKDWANWVYKSTIKDLVKFKYDSQKAKAIVEYLRYAKTLEPYALADNGWEPHRGEKASGTVYQDLIKEGMAFYKNTPFNEIKLRYGYQLVRFAHYSGENEQAVKLFDAYVKPLDNNNIIYYYALEQMGGVLTNQNKIGEASYLFSRVFDNTKDKKESAYLSIKLQNEKDWKTALKKCKSGKEKAALYAMRGYNAFNDEMAEVENIMKVDAGSPYTELLAVRYINKLERQILTVPNGYSYYQDDKGAPTFLSPSQEITNQINKAQEIVVKMIKNKGVERKDFWNVYLAHLSFLKRDTNKVNAILDEVKTNDEALLKQISRTRFNAYLASLTELGAKEEQKIKEYLGQKSADKDYIYEVVAHVYKMRGQDAKAFMVHNTIPALFDNPNLKIIDDLIKSYEGNIPFVFLSEGYVEEPVKNILASLYDLKGTYYWRNNDLQNALVWFNKVPNEYQMATYDYNWETKKRTKRKFGKTEFNGYSNIPKLIFSNRIKMSFEAAQGKVMTDVVVNLKGFSFIPKMMNKKTLVTALIKLEAMSKENSELGAQANYLLGNYYQNISGAGYYRNIPFYKESNWYNSNLYSTGQEVKVDDLSAMYNYKSIGYTVMVNNDLKKILEYYKLAIANSKDKEFKAKAVFMAASVERDIYFGQDYNTWYDLKKDANARVYDYFSTLKVSYKTTKFYKEALSKCKYFEYYVGRS